VAQTLPACHHAPTCTVGTAWALSAAEGPHPRLSLAHEPLQVSAQGTRE